MITIKKCKTCGIQFEKTKDNFFFFNQKTKRKDGTYNIHVTCSPYCKKCHSRLKNIRRVSEIEKSYIAELSRVNVSDITEEIYQLKKLNLLIKREIKKIKYNNNEK